MALHVSKNVAELPNVKRMFIPDRGMMLFDCDLSGADAQVVAWEADDAALKALFRRGENIHEHNANDIFGDDWRNAVGHKKNLGTPKGLMYYDTKRGVHATNYVGSARTLAITLGWSIARAEAFQRKWFQLHPGIRTWHQRCTHSLRTTRRVTNAFGYHRIYFERPDDVLPEAVAWIPQSTIAETCFRGAIALDDACPWVDILLQVHDSLVFQVPMHRADDIDEIKRHLLNPVPYADPLIIDWKLTRSEKSWGDCGEFTLKQAA